MPSDHPLINERLEIRTEAQLKAEREQEAKSEGTPTP